MCILSIIYHWHWKVVMGGDLSSLTVPESVIETVFMQLATGKSSPWWPFRSNIVLFVLRKGAYISMTSNMHAKIREKNEILINLTAHCTLMKPRLTGFIDLSFPPNTSDPHQDFSNQTKCIWQISLKNQTRATQYKYKCKPNTNAATNTS